MKIAASVKPASFSVHGSSFIVPSVLFGLALAARLIYALQIHFPPLDDPAYYIQAARSLRGPNPLNFELSITWNFEPLFPGVRHPGMEFWMPLSSLVMSFSFWLFGDNFLAAQLPSLICGSLLPVYTYFFARRYLSTRLSIFAGLLMVFNPLLAYQSTLPDSSMLYAALVCPAILLMGNARGTERSERYLKPLALGVLVGLAYLARTPAVFLALTYFLLILNNFRLSLKTYRPPTPSTLTRSRSEVPLSSFLYPPSSILLPLSSFLLGLALPVGAWSLRNWLLFGYISSPAGTQTIFLFDYQDLFNYRASVSLSTWLQAGPGKIIGIRLEALWSAWRNVLDPLAPPLALISAIGLGWLAKRESSARPAALYSLLLFLGVPLIFAVASLNGSYYHSAGSCAPFLATGLVYLISKFQLLRKPNPQSVTSPPLGATRGLTPFGGNSQLATLVLSLLLLLNVALLVLNAGPAIAVHRQDEALYGRIRDWLAANPAPAVITNQPASLNYISGVPAVRLPTNQGLAVLQEVARKYGATYVIVTEVSGLYPTLLDAPDNKLFPLVYQGGDFEVFGVPQN